MTQPLRKLSVIGVRYLGGRRVSGPAIPLEKYQKSNVYSSAQIPYELIEPVIPGDKLTDFEVLNVGLLGGLIADQVSSARMNDSVVLMTGGNCCHSTGIIGGLQDAHGSEARIGLVWFDAHGDFNTAKITLSGMLGGMPVAVATGLTYPEWRQLSHIVSPLPTDRIILVDVRNLDHAEEQLIRATDVRIASVATGFPGEDLKSGLTDLVDKVDMIYLHVDSDILDEAYTPNHWTKEPKGPNRNQVIAAIDLVMATGKVVAYAVVSVNGEGPGSEIMIDSGIKLIRCGLESWKKYGTAKIIQSNSI